MKTFVYLCLTFCFLSSAPMASENRSDEDDTSSRFEDFAYETRGDRQTFNGLETVAGMVVLSYGLHNSANVIPLLKLDRAGFIKELKKLLDQGTIETKQFEKYSKMAPELIKKMNRLAYVAGGYLLLDGVLGLVVLDVKRGPELSSVWRASTLVYNGLRSPSGDKSSSQESEDKKQEQSSPK